MGEFRMRRRTRSRIRPSSFSFRLDLDGEAGLAVAGWAVAGWAVAGLKPDGAENPGGGLTALGPDWPKTVTDKPPTLLVAT